MIANKIITKRCIACKKLSKIREQLETIVNDLCINENMNSNEESYFGDIARVAIRAEEQLDKIMQVTPFITPAELAKRSEAKFQEELANPRIIIKKVVA